MSDAGTTEEEVSSPLDDLTDNQRSFYERLTDRLARHHGRLGRDTLTREERQLLRSDGDVSLDEIARYVSARENLATIAGITPAEMGERIVSVAKSKEVEQGRRSVTRMRLVISAEMFNAPEELEELAVADLTRALNGDPDRTIQWEVVPDTFMQRTRTL